MRFSTALVLVALTGFTALSHEICWARLYSFLSASRAWAFAGMLCAYLLGLALGSLWSIRFQERYQDSGSGAQSAIAGKLVLAAAAAGFLLPPVVSWLAVPVPYTLTLVLVIGASALLGTLLPLICHFAVPPDARVGARLSRLYLANIAGSGAGSLLTGFVLMEHLPMRWIVFLLVVLSAVIHVLLHPAGAERRRALTRAGVLTAAAAALTPVLYWQFWERLQYKSEWGPDKKFAEVVESRSGVITVDQENYIYGGGVYDGVIEVSPAINPWLVRAYAIAAYHPAPEDVLMIGLSGGSWAQIVAALPSVKRLTVVEINRAYLEVIRRHPVVSSLLDNPKVEIVIDDGRRWMEYNRDRRFDAILMNTTHHWREFASNLLSREFLQLAGSRLKPGGFFEFNTTDSLRAARTALDLFPDVQLLLNFAVVSHEPLVWDNARFRDALDSWRIDGKPVLNPDVEPDRTVREKMLTLGETAGLDPETVAGRFPVLQGDPRYRILNRAQLDAAAAGARPITDDNLGHEYDW